MSKQKLRRGWITYLGMGVSMYEHKKLGLVVSNWCVLSENCGYTLCRWDGHGYCPPENRYTPTHKSVEYTMIEAEQARMRELHQCLEFIGGE